MQDAGVFLVGLEDYNHLWTAGGVLVDVAEWKIVDISPPLAIPMRLW